MKLTKNRLTRRLSPRMRGCFSNSSTGQISKRAFPAYAGMFLEIGVAVERSAGFPRVCGDVSINHFARRAAPTLSPRMRGCFRASDERTSNECAFPAYAGMFPIKNGPRNLSRSFPRVCGDVSLVRRGKRHDYLLSPRMRGCFRASGEITPKCEAFPAYAGMFLELKPKGQSFSSFPRVCGDVSIRAVRWVPARSLSPRMRGCFLVLVTPR